MGTDREIRGRRDNARRTSHAANRAAESRYPTGYGPAFRRASAGNIASATRPVPAQSRGAEVAPPSGSWIGLRDFINPNCARLPAERGAKVDDLVTRPAWS